MRVEGPKLSWRQTTENVSWHADKQANGDNSTHNDRCVYTCMSYPPKCGDESPENFQFQIPGEIIYQRGIIASHAVVDGKWSARYDAPSLLFRGFAKRIIAYITVNRVRREHYLCLMRQGNMLPARTPEYIPKNWIFNGNKYVSEPSSCFLRKYEDYALP